MLDADKHHPQHRRSGILQASPISDELRLAVHALQNDQAQLNAMTLNAARGSFLPAEQKNTLIQKLDKSFNGIP
jgi:adenosine deaminase